MPAALDAGSAKGARSVSRSVPDGPFTLTRIH